MAFKYLNVAEMLGLTQKLVEQGTPENVEVSKYAELVWMLPHITTSHNALRNTQLVPEEEAIKVIYEKEQVVDDTHDIFVKGVTLVLTGLSMISSEELAKKLIALREQLFLDGLAVTQMSYRAEYGQVQLRASRLTDESRELLESIVLPEGVLTDALDVIDDAANTLGELEDEKAKLLKTKKNPSAKEVLRSRNSWIKLMNSFVSAFHFVDPVSEELKDIFDRLKVAEDNATKRAKRSKLARIESVDTTPEPVDEPLAPKGVEETPKPVDEEKE